MKYIVFTIILAAVLRESHLLNPEILKYDPFLKDFQATGRALKQEGVIKKMDGLILKREYKLPGKAKNIFEAVNLNDEDAVRYYVEEENLDLKNIRFKQKTAAHIASEKGHLEILKYLLEKEPELAYRVDEDGDDVFFLAIKNNHLDIVKYLDEKQLVDIRESYDRHSLTGLHRAAAYGFLDIVKYFMSRNFDVNVLNTLNQPPVFFAAESKHYDVIKYLVEEKNANLTLADIQKQNILYKAVPNDDVDLLRYVLDDRKVPLDVNWKDEFRSTVVLLAAYGNRYQALVYLVDEKHGDINAVDFWRQTPLHYAVQESHYAICKFLLERGAKINLKNDQWMTPLEEATDQRIIQMIKEALRNAPVRKRRKKNFK